MKILLLADEPDLGLWDHLDRRRLEGIDLVISAGDLPAEYLSFLTCFTNAPILYVYGNHDSHYAKKPPEGCICIDDRLVEFQGLRIVGLGGCMRYKVGPYMYSEREMRQRIKKLRFPLFRSKGVDLIIAHAPMQGIGDAEDLAHRGFESLRKMVEKYQPKYFVHGHVHKSYDFRFKRVNHLNDTTVINAWVSHVIEIDPPDAQTVGRIKKADHIE